MKQEQQQQARRMFIQSDLSKTDIASSMKVDRRTIYQWSIDGDWEKLKASAKAMPSILAEKCYYLIGQFTDHLLGKDIPYQSVTKSDVDIIYKLAKTINILKKGSTVNEDMETFTWFLEGLHKRDAGLAEALIPYVDTFVSCRNATSPSEFMLSGHDKQGFKPFPEKDITERWRDEEDAAAILKEMQQAATENQSQTNNARNEASQPVSNTNEETTQASSGTENEPSQQTVNNVTESTDYITSTSRLTREQKDAIRRTNYQQRLEQKRIKKEQNKQ